MTGFRLLLVFSLLTGLAAQECEISAEDIESFYDRVLVTNASTELVWVSVMLDHSETALLIGPGKSKTATGVLSSSYSVTVVSRLSNGAETYRQRLEAARDDLVELTLDSRPRPGQIEAAATDLALVVDALAQIEGDGDGKQSCSGTIETGVDAHVTVALQTTVTGTESWSIDCG